jgi:Glu-tRNA(Gln) amidotransferase subunit E-like FAD-binding protein
MSPEELRTKILVIAEYLENEENPSRTVVASSVRTILAEIKTANDITNFIHKEFNSAADGLENYIQRLNQWAAMYPQQDAARIIIDESIKEIENFKTSMISRYTSLSSISDL